MTRRELIKAGLLALPVLSLSPLKAFSKPLKLYSFTKADFGEDFLWGVASASYQIEGAWDKDGKGLSIWDTFSHKKGKILKNHNGNVACNFYNNYEKDIEIVKSLNMDVFRFSISWARILPKGKGEINQKGLNFYHKVIDKCIEEGLQPWITCYHWDLPQALEDEGGWASRKIIKWFRDYVEILAKEYGDKVKNWMVMNEPLAFVGLGYMGGQHAPGKMNLGKFMKAIHYCNLSMAEGGRALKNNVKDGNIGSTWSCTHVDPKKPGVKKHEKAAVKADAFFNRMMIEPSLGLGYPFDDLSFINPIKKHIEPGDEEILKFDWDFIGLQNYFRTVARHSIWPPLLWVNMVKGKKLVEDESELTAMGWEISPDGFYKILKEFSAYNKEIIVTENGAAFEDKVENERVHDKRRVKFYQDYLSALLKAKKEGINITGYFAWSFIDNFEWAEGYHGRFGLVHNNFETQKRTIKDSGYWFQSFLKD